MKKVGLMAWIFLAIPIALFCQTRQITGTVRDAAGGPVPLATIQQKGTNNAVTADENGSFSITVNGANPVLVISSVSFQTTEVIIGNASSYSIELRADKNLDEVVVTALGIKKEKKALGYSAQEVKGEEITATKQTNIVNALRGKVAGVQINSGGGAPGQGARILIRGIKSLSPGKNNQPLFVIDGVVMDNSTTTVSSAGDVRGLSNRAADINPDDVESISVLRGGAATALYGQAGSNGVVLITTKQGQAGTLRVNLTTTYGIDEVNKFPEVQTKFSQGSMGVYSSTNFFPSWGPDVATARGLDPTHPEGIYDHYARGYKNGNQFRTSVNLSGGNQNALLSSSFSYFKQNGVIPNSDYKNITARLSGQFRAGTKFRFSPSVYFINSGGYRVNADRYNEQLSYWSPRHDVMDYINPNGTMKTYGNDNPVYGTSVNRFKDNVNRILANAALTFSPWSWLDLDYKVGIDHVSDFRRHTGPGPTGVVGEISFSDNGLGFVDEYRISNRILNSNAMASFKYDFTDKFNAVLRVGNEVREIKYSRVTASGTELDIPSLLSLNNAKQKSNSQYEELYRIVSAYGDLMLSWDNFLFVNVTGRNDWSSTLSQDNNSFFYPSVSLSYVFSSQFQLPTWFSFGKLRASLAEIGKDTDPYETNTYFGSSTLRAVSQVVWSRGDTRGDVNLKPERTTTLEIGTDLRFFNNRLGLDFTWYKLNSRDQIIPVAVSPTSGFGSVIINAGEIENKGVEIVLNATPVYNQDFSWEATLNFSANRNKVLSLREGLTEIVVASHFGYAGSTATMKYVPGFPVGNIYGSSYLRYYGSAVTDDSVTLYNDLPLVIASTGTNAGFPRRDGTQRILGNSQPDWIGGLNNIFSYKNFTLSFLWETQQGQYRYNQLGNFMAAFGIAKYTEDRTESKVFDGVLADGTKNTQTVWLGQGVGPDGRNYTAGFYRNVYRTVTENFVEDASWVRLRNLSLSYSIPANKLRNSFIRGITLTLTGNNLLLFTDYSGYDPESSSFPASSNVDAFSGFTYPAVRSYLFSINVNL